MKKLLIIFMVLLHPIMVFANDKPALASTAKSAILIESTTGKIIFEKNSHEKLAPASMTKIMSMLLIMENIDKGIIKWNDKVTASKNASSMGGSQILLEEGEVMTVKDLFKGIAVASGNDAVVAMAEHIAGSEEEFVKMMNDKAKELKLKDTVFKNPHGLDIANHYSSAHDMAIIAKNLVKYEDVLKFTSIYEDYLRKGTERELWLVNTNKLVKFNKYVDGLKTGYTKEAGYCLTATAIKNGMRLISVVMGEPDPEVRSSETVSLLDYGFSKFSSKTVVNKKQLVEKYNKEKFQKPISIITKEKYSVIREKNKKIGKITYKLKLNNIKIPTKKNTKVGVLDIKENNKKIGSVDVIAKDNVKKTNIINLFGRYLKSIISGDV